MRLQSASSRRALKNEMIKIIYAVNFSSALWIKCAAQESDQILLKPTDVFWKVEERWEKECFEIVWKFCDVWFFKPVFL